MNSQPIFKAIFGKSFQQLPLVLQKRYSNRSHCSEQITVHGVLNIHTSMWMKLLSPALRLCELLSLTLQKTFMLRLSLKVIPPQTLYALIEPLITITNLPILFLQIGYLNKMAILLNLCASDLAGK